MSEKNLIDAFTKWRGRFLRQVLRMLPSEEDAEDVLQDAFVRLWPLSDSIRSIQEAQALTATTVRNLSIDRYRAARHTQMSEERQADMEELADTENEEDSRMVIVEEIMKRVLTATQRKIIQMREYEQMSYEQIAVELKMQPPAVRMQLSRARKAIRDEYRLIKSKE